jgi:CheY-like chemotaxis protein
MSTQPLVLVADDEPRITKLVAIALSEEGFRVVTANGGEQALQKAEEVRPDIVLLDIVMPDLDGIEVMRQLRERRPVPVILLTAKGSTADKAKGLDLGADDYIAKPFHPDELAARVRAVIRRSGGAEPGAGVIKFDDVEIDLERRMVTRNGELVGVERLGDVVVGAEVEALGLVGGRALGREQDHRHRPALTQLAHDLDAVEVGHHDVQQDDVRPDLLRLLEGLLATVGGDDAEALLRQRDGHELGDSRLVVRDEHERLSGHWSLPGSQRFRIS